MKRQKSAIESEDGGDGGGQEWFRVRVNMERYFSDERALAYVAVPVGGVRGWRRVRWLAARLRGTFGLPRAPFALLCRGHLLPPGEPLALLRPDDLLDVVPARATVGLHEDEPATSGAVGHCGGDARLAAGAAAPELVDEAELSEHKRRALLLLERCGARGDEPDAPHVARRRRRVRRRRRDPASPPPPPPPPPPGAEDGGGGGVVRNGVSAVRAPRLVHPEPSA